jgi:CubicO group peptidase (beta-lactamase class C family)
MNTVTFRRSALLLAAFALSPPLLPVPIAHAYQSAAGTAASSAPKTTPERLDAIEKEIEKRRVAAGIPGAALVIVQGDKIIYLKGLGLRDVGRNKPVTPDTLFAIGSSSKSFTAAAVLMSQDDGKLSLDDSPKKVLPYFKLQDPEADAKVTIRDLMSHGSGLPRTDLAWISGALTREEGIRVLADVKPTAPFRKRFQYQNLMFSAAGEIASRVQKMPYETLIETRLFRPLGMTNSNLRVRTMQKSTDFAIGYVPDAVHPGSRALAIRDIEAVAPAGAINSSARDMAQWLRFLLKRGVAPGGTRLLSEAGFQEMVKPQMTISPRVMEYGLGWFIRKWQGLTVLEHGGNIDGFNAQVALLPEKNLGFVLLTNVTGSPLAQSSLNIVWSNLVDLPADQAALSVDAGPAVAPKDEAGTYLLGSTRMIVAVTDNGLTLSVPGQPIYPLERLSGRRYKLAAPAPDGFFITFRPVKDKPAASEASLEQPNGTFVLTKDAQSVAETTADFIPPISVDELLGKMVSAAGGEDALRRHKTLAVTGRAVLENQGLVATTEYFFQYPNRREQRTTLYALGTKVVGKTRDYFDGMSGRFESNFSPASEYTGNVLYDTGIESFLQPLMDARKIFPNLVIVGRKALDGEDVLVLKKKPALGSPIVEYVSLTSFLVVRRDFATGSGSSADTAPQGRTEAYSDYRMVDGEAIPFKTITRSPSLGTQVETVVTAKFNVPVPGNAFMPGKETTRDATK